MKNIEGKNYWIVIERKNGKLPYVSHSEAIRDSFGRTPCEVLNAELAPHLRAAGDRVHRASLIREDGTVAVTRYPS